MKQNSTTPILRKLDALALIWTITDHPFLCALKLEKRFYTLTACSDEGEQTAVYRNRADSIVRHSRNQIDHHLLPLLRKEGITGW